MSYSGVQYILVLTKGVGSSDDGGEHLKMIRKESPTSDTRQPLLRVLLITYIPLTTVPLERSKLKNWMTSKVFHRYGCYGNRCDHAVA